MESRKFKTSKMTVLRSEELTSCHTFSVNICTCKYTGPLIFKRLKNVMSVLKSYWLQLWQTCKARVFVHLSANFVWNINKQMTSSKLDWPQVTLLESTDLCRYIYWSNNSKWKDTSEKTCYHCSQPRLTGLKWCCQSKYIYVDTMVK